MTGAEMVTRCETRFGDTSNDVYSEAEWLAYINEAYRLFLRRAKFRSLTAEATLAIAADGRTATLDSASLQGGVIDVLLNGDPLDPQPPLSARQIRHMTDRATIPMFYEVRGKRLSVLPAWSAGGNVTVVYLTAPTAIASGTSPVIPETYHDALVAGALALAFRDDENAEMAGALEQEFAGFIASATEDTGAQEDK